MEDSDITDYEGFEKNLEFIFSKISVNPQFYAYTEETDRAEILSTLIKKASVINKDDWNKK